MQCNALGARRLASCGDQQAQKPGTSHPRSITDLLSRLPLSTPLCTHTIQNCITAVIFFGMLEMSVWYFDYVNFNNSGFRPYSTTVAAVLIGSVRKTLSRTLLLVVAMGFGVVRPTLGGISLRVLALVRMMIPISPVVEESHPALLFCCLHLHPNPPLTLHLTHDLSNPAQPPPPSRVAPQSLAYFAGTCVLDVMTNVGSIDDLTDSARIVLVLPVAVLDAVFIMWIFTSLSRTLTQLQARRQLPKLHLYRHFTNLMAVAVIISVVWIGFEMYFKVTDSFNEAWQSDWVTGAFWHVLNFVIVVGICALWRPTDTAAQYGWVEGQQTPEEWDDEAGGRLEAGRKARAVGRVNVLKRICCLAPVCLFLRTLFSSGGKLSSSLVLAAGEGRSRGRACGRGGRRGPCWGVQHRGRRGRRTVEAVIGGWR